MRSAGGDEYLVEFISGGVKENDEHGDDGCAPTPRAGIAADGFADSAPEQEAENGIFREVTAFPKHMVKRLDVRLGHMRKEPVQERVDEPGGVGVGLRISGAEKNQGHPCQGHEPIFQK